MSTTEAATIWYANTGEGEFTGSSPVDITDTSANLLVDHSSNNVTDDSSLYTPVATTTWSDNDGS